MNRIKTRLHEILNMPGPGDSVSRIFRICIMALILINVVSVIYETTLHPDARAASLFGELELFSVIVFTLEYLARLWTCTKDPRFRRPVMGRLRFAITALAIVDLLAIAPFYLPMILPVDLRFLRALRLFRIFRLFKLGRYSNSLRTLGAVFRSKKEDLLMVLFGMGLLLVIGCSLMYFAEHKAQPESFGSIPAAMWWGVVTLTSAGYSVAVPVTAFGKVIGGIISLLRIGMFALPAGILSSGFVGHMRRQRETPTIVCPHCGTNISTPSAPTTEPQPPQADTTPER